MGGVVIVISVRVRVLVLKKKFGSQKYIPIFTIFYINVVSVFVIINLNFISILT